MADQITQLYDIKLVGAGELISNMGNVNGTFKEAKKNFQALKEALSQKGLSSGEIGELKAKLELARVEMKKLQVQQQEGRNDTIAYNNALADQKLAAKKAADGNNSVEGSVNSLRATLKALKADFNQKVNVQVLSEAEIKKELAGIQQLEDKLRSVTRNHSSEGTNVGEYTRGILQAFQQNGLDGLIKSQIDKTKAEVQSLDSVFEGLKAELSEIRVTGTGSLENIEARLVENRTEAERLREQLASVEGELRGMGGVGAQVVNGFKESFKDLRGQLAQFVVGYLGFQAAIAGVHEIISANKELSDSYADLLIRLHGNKEAADEVVASLRNIKTRTDIGELIDTGSLLAKKGVATEEIQGITKALDDYFVVAGKEGGNREEGTASIVKLISIFNDDKHVTKERVEEISAALIGLQNSGVATGSKMIDLAERIGSVRGLTGVTLPNVLGLAAAVEQLGQKTEVGGTAGVQILSKMLSDVPKYANAAGMSVDSFRKILKDNPIEALVRLAQNLTKKGEGFEKVASDFEEVGVKGAKVKAFLADVGTNGEFVIKRMKDAAIAIGDTASVAADADIKQQTFAANLAKIGNDLKLAFTNSNIAAILDVIGKSLLFLVNVLTAIPFSVVITGLATVTAAWAFLKGNTIAATLAQSANNEATLLGSVRLFAMRQGLFGAAAQQEAMALRARLTTVALEEETVATEGATLATEGLNAATRVSPLGIILAILAILIPTMAAFGHSTDAAAGSINGLSGSLEKNKEVESSLQLEVQKQTGKTKASIQELVTIIKTEKDNISLRQKAYEALIKISPEFTGTLDAEYNATDRLNTVYDTYIKQLDKVARAKAIQTVNQKRQDDLVSAQTAEFEAKQKLDADKQVARVQDAKNVNYLNASGNQNITQAQFDKEEETRYNSYNTKEKQAYDEAKKKAKDAMDAVKQFDTFIKGASQDDKEALVTGITGDGNSPIAQRTEAAILSDLKKAKAGLKNAVIGSPEFAQYKAEVDRLNQELVDDGFKKAKGGGSKDSESDTAEKLRDAQIKAVDDEFNIQKNDLQRRNLTEENSAIALNVLVKKYADQKLAILRNALTTEKGLTETQKQDIKLKQSEALLDEFNSDKELQKKRYELESKQAETAFTNSKQDAADQLSTVNDNPNATASDKAKAQESYDNHLISLQIGFMADMDALELQFKQKSTKNERDRFEALKNLAKQAADDERAINAAKIADITTQGERQVAAYGSVINDRRQLILDSSRTQEQKQAALDILDREENIGRLSRQIATDKQLLANEKLTADERYRIQEDYVKKQIDLKKAMGGSSNEANGGTDINATDLGSGISKGVRSLLSFNTVNDNDSTDDKAKKISEQQLFAETVADTYKFAGTAMDAYFDGERIAIENSLKLQERQLDSQRLVALGHAQSAAEQDTIDREFQAKKLAAEKTAFEQNKKMQIAQAEINLAMQLSNLGVVAFGPSPLNIATLGGAGAIMYAIQAALAIGSFAVNVSKINAAQFATGGIAGMGNGKITQSGNIPTRPNGDNILATVKTGEVILNEQQQRALGGASTFASIGVPGFANGGTPGGFMSSFANGGHIGSVLQPPVFRAYYDDPSLRSAGNSADSEARLQRLEANIDRVGQLVAMETVKKVQVVSKDMTNQQSKDRKNAAIGTL